LNNPSVKPKSGGSMANAIYFVVYMVIGWLGLAYLSFFTPGGFSGAWQFVRNLSGLIQVLIWVIFLPLMIIMWVYYFGWALWLRLVVIAGIIVATYLISIPPLIQLLRAPK
jgi:hypothetical protein